MNPNERVDLMRPAPGWVRCCICFEARQVQDLLMDTAAGKPWDICREGPCAEQAGLNPDGSEMDSITVPSTICTHCGRRQQGSSGFTTAGQYHPLCHTDTGMDCYRLVTVHRHPVRDCLQCAEEIEAQQLAQQLSEHWGPVPEEEPQA